MTGKECLFGAVKITRNADMILTHMNILKIVLDLTEEELFHNLVGIW